MGELLRVSEVFLSIQGESTRAGLPCAMVRLAGCNLRCAWCDTKYAWDAGQPRTVRQVLDEVAALCCRRVEVTGGEPLLQPAALELLRGLCEAGFETLLETNGTCDLSGVDGRVVRIVDVKCPSSGEGGSFRRENLDLLTGRDEVKFVLADRGDFDFAAGFVRRHDLTGCCAVIFSPVAGRLAPATLAEWILAEGLDVRLGVQLHKVIWPDAARGR